MMMRLLLILVFSMLLVLGSLKLARADNERLLIRWEPNPVAESIQWYIVKHDDGSASAEMPVLDQTSFLDAESGQHQSIIPLSRLNVEVGDEICIRIQAARGIDRSTDSEAACLVWTEEPDEPQPPQLAISQPTIVSITIIRD